MSARENSSRPQANEGDQWDVNDYGDSRAINCTHYSAINCKVDLDGGLSASGHLARNVSALVADLIRDSLSENTRRAYHFDLAHFEAWGGGIPASPERIAHYLADLASTYAPATISRRLAALSKAHRARGLDDPTKAEIVKSTLRGIKRTLGTAQREAKPILKDDLFSMLERMDDSTKDQRDKALLLIGFAAALRRSELVGLDVADIEHVRQGIVITLRRSKTDQIGAGRKIGIPFGRRRWCPVKHLTAWLDHAGITEGPIFRSVGRGGHISPHRLSTEAVSILVKQHAQSARFDPDAYSGHSLRAGLATSAAMVGASTLSIRRTTGHASDAMLARYVRIGDIFMDNAAGAVL